MTGGDAKERAAPGRFLAWGTGSSIVGPSYANSSETRSRREACPGTDRVGTPGRSHGLPRRAGRVRVRRHPRRAGCRRGGGHQAQAAGGAGGGGAGAVAAPGGAALAPISATAPAASGSISATAASWRPNARKWSTRCSEWEGSAIPPSPP